jgi:hypothetical protein
MSGSQSKKARDNMTSVGKLWLYIFVGGLLIGLLFLGWITILGPEFNKADYNNFNSSSQHMQAISQRFADDCQQIAETSDPVAKKAIEQDIYQISSTVELNTVQMPTGVRSCVNKAISDVTGGK